MLDHISLGVADVARTRKFYDAVLGPLGCKRLSNSDDSLGYGTDSVVLWLNKAVRPVSADKESGLHFCFAAPDRKAVDRFHAAALAQGGGDNGAPGLRADYGDNYYAAFVIDPDGYRIEAYCGKPA